VSKILPEPLVGQFPAEVIEIYQSLKAIPGDDITVWVSLPLAGCEGRPDFLVVSRDRSAFLIAVARDGQADFEEAAGLSLFRADGDDFCPGRNEAERLRGFFFAALAHLDESDEKRAVTGLVIFPNVSQATLDQMPVELRPKDVFLLGKDFCNPRRLAEFLEKETPPELESEAILVLRSAFTPESVVPPRFSSMRPPERNIGARLAPMLLDYDQEQWAKHRLVLSPQAATVAEDGAAYSGASLVTGVAGSGKSLVLLFRACTQAKQAPATRSLVLTHNRALKTELELRFGELGRPPNVQWHTFYSWVHHLIAARKHFPDIVQYAERDRWIAESARSSWGDLSSAQVDFLREEFDWMQDRDLVEEAAYLEAERGGRGVRLGEAARRKVFAAYRAYRGLLVSEGREDWSGVALHAWRLIQSGGIQPPLFDFIYIDEAQFFAPVWFYIIRAALMPETGRIHLAADPTQGFLKRRQAWSQCGLDLRGRSTRLRKSYRSTRQVLSFASNFYRQRIHDDELPELNLPGEEELSSAHEGDKPMVVRLSARQDELARVANEIAACLRGGIPPGDILVIVAGENRFPQCLAALTGVLGENLVEDAREESSHGRVRLCGINAATGLEAPVVFLVGIADLIAAESDYRLKEEARAELIRDNTRRIYMAATRAARKLVVTWTGSTSPAWITEETEACQLAEP
jgi:superfamily I DNA/RNA helicase